MRIFKFLLLPILILLLILLIIQYIKYTKSNKDYEIEQQELEYISGDELYTNNNPMVITFIEKMSLYENIKLYKIFTSLSWEKKYYNLNSVDNYIYHSNELLFIKSKAEVKIELINPKYKKYFEKKDSYNNLCYYELTKDNYENVVSFEVIIRDYNILYIPRFWLFKINTPQTSLEICETNSLFTKIYKKIYT
tara:strand:+ start:497 stop:1075 length:579 start_codon:yes stop_codon:yes gene_type:complete